MPLPAAPLVGREDDLASLTAAVAAARHGAGTAVLVVGDAGVGKTRLVHEALAASRQAGDLVLVGHCVNLAVSAPYLPIVDALRGLGRDEPAAAESLARHPAVHALVAPAPERVAGAELYEDLLAVLLELAVARPVLLLIEDVHWADAATRDLLGFLLTRLPGGRVTVWLTVRSDDLHRRHPLRPALAEWSRLPGVSRRVLAPLDDSALRAMVAAHHPAPLDGDLLERICSRSGGNPFFVEQLLAAADRDEQLPLDLADLVLVQVEALSPAALRVVRAAAVGGREIDDRRLTEITGLSGDDLDGALREAADAHVLVPVRGSYGFRHALLAEAVYEDLLPGERVRLHTAFAAALAGGSDAGGERGGEQDADLARHAQASFDLPTAYAAAVRAAARALDLAAPAQALTLYEQAGAMVSRVDGADPATLAVLTAEAAALAGHPYRAVTVLDAALAEVGADDPRRVPLLVASAQHRVRLDLPEDSSEISAAALAMLPDEVSEIRGQALAVHAHVQSVFGRDGEARALATEALGMGRALRLPLLVSSAITTLARVSAHSDPVAAEQTLREQAATAATAGESITEMRAWHALAGLHHYRGAVEAALDAYGRAQACGEAAGQPWATYALDSRAIAIALLGDLGRLSDALHLVERPVAGPVPAPPPAYARNALDTLGLGAIVARGDDDRAWAVITAGREWQQRDGLFALHTAYAEVELAGRRDGAAAATVVHDAAVRRISGMWQQPWFPGRLRLHALLIGQLPAGDLELAGRLLGAARQTADEQVRRGSRLGPEGRAWLARVEAETVRLRWLAGVDRPAADELVDAWTAAAEAFGETLRYEQLRSRLRRAEVLTATGEAAAGRAEAETVLAAARDIGARPLAAAAKAALGARAESAGEITLTPRERQVLTLVADGRSNGQIGRQLFISDKTVSVHVSNVLAKLGAASRTEAAAIARRDGLLA